MSQVIKIESSSKSFSAFGGLHLFERLLSKVGLRVELEAGLPVSPKHSRPELFEAEEPGFRLRLRG